MIDRDETLALLLADLQAKGGDPDFTAVSREHPELVDELRSLWATAQFASLLRSPTSPVSPPATFASPPALNLPDYEILGELGRGGMGIVYKARQRSLNRIVALKILRDGKLAGEEDKARFRAEATAAGKLHDPRIVTVHEVGEHEGMPYIAMEYVDGETLGARLKGGPMPARDAAALAAEIAEAVQHAHERGILHRDLKPSNILLQGNRIKVSDFGLAKRLFLNADSLREWRTETGAIVGTPGYMAPEQATNRMETTPASDVYSIGAILYEMLTGRPPFQAANPMDALLMVIEQDPVPPRMLVPGIDRDLENICLRCLQKSPHRRYSSAAGLANDLNAYLAGDDLSSKASGLRHFVSRMMRETHHVGVLENWGLIWMWHSLQIFLLCLATQVMAWAGVTYHGAYLMLWSVGLLTWAPILWKWRARSGPVLFVERQIAHAWAAGVCASICMFVIEVVAGLPALTLSPAIAVAAGMVFVFKAGILSGRFYVTAALMFFTAMVMPLFPQVQILLFGATSALSFLVPGVKYYRLRKRSEATP